MSLTVEVFIEYTVFRIHLADSVSIDMWALLHSAADPLAFVAIGGFLAATGLDAAHRRSHASLIAAGSWIAFGAFWFAMFPYFYGDFQSPLYSVLSLAAVPLCVIAAYHLLQGRRSLLQLSRAVGVMGLIYLPAILYEPFTRWLVELTAVHTVWAMDLVGYRPALIEAPNGYMTKFDMEPYSGETYSTYMVLACTGLGSMAIFGGLIAAARASLKRKAIAFGMVLSIIWVLNLVRNAFVALASPLGWFDYPIFESITVTLAGPMMRTSYFVSHHLISQTGAVFALVGIALLVMRIIPEILAVIDEALFVVTGSEYQLADSLGQKSALPDGGEVD